jgi:hypothetical protein
MFSAVVLALSAFLPISSVDPLSYVRSAWTSLPCVHYYYEPLTTQHIQEMALSSSLTTNIEVRLHSLKVCDPLTVSMLNRIVV